MKLIDIIRNDFKYMASVSVDVDRHYGWVSIEDDNGQQDCIFLQGDEASHFIDEADSLWNELEDVTHDEVYAHLAKPYVDCIWN